jgi:hypothetical protein
MKHHPGLAALLAGVSISACGGGGDGAAAPAPSATGASTAPATPGAPDTTAASAKLPSACALVTRADATRAFGRRAHAGTGAGPQCTYNLGTQFISVQTQTATADAVASMVSSFAHPVPGSKRVHVAGFDGLVRPIIRPGQAGGAQWRIVLVRGTTILVVLATDTRVRHARSLSGTVTRLGRAAANRA